MSVMRQTWIAAQDRVEVRTVERPEPGPGDVRVASTVVGICGSDVHALHGTHPFIDLPVAPGHEAAGVVTALGEGVDELALGQRVLLQPNLVDGICWYCRTGRQNLCENLKVVGCQTAGALGE